MRRPAADFLLLATVTLWALNFTASKYILEHGFRPLAYSSVRYALAALLFTAIVLPRERSLRVGRSDLKLLGAGAILLFANQVCFIYALKFTTATTVALLFGTLPIFTALIASAVGMERLSRRFWLAAAVSFAGVALVALGSSVGLSADLKGDALAVGGAVTWAGYSVLIASLMRRYSPYRLSALFLLAVTLPLALFGSGQLASQSFDLGWAVWAWFAFAVLGPLVITNVTWFTAIDRVGPSRASLFANLQPFLAAIVALLVLDETLTRTQVAGGLLIGCGILLAPRFQAVAAGAER
ncbi:MAG: DMT family transporter [Actinomycetota bacterium]|nr:DMT family transporter [Actinomycetota bacterium]